MVRAFSQLKRILDERKMSVPELWRRLEEQSVRIDRRRLSRLTNERAPLERLDLRLAGAICQVCRVPLSALVLLDAPLSALRRLSAGKQKRLDALMAKNSTGKLSAPEREELRRLVRDAEEVALGNARRLAGQGDALTSR